jgi:hypothetical protein
MPSAKRLGKTAKSHETPRNFLKSSTCPKLSNIRDFIFGNTDPSFKWDVDKLSDYLSLVADKLETISPDQEELVFINPYGQEIKIIIDPMEDSSLVNF